MKPSLVVLWNDSTVPGGIYCPAAGVVEVREGETLEEALRIAREELSHHLGRKVEARPFLAAGGIKDATAALERWSRGEPLGLAPFAP